MTSIQPKTEFLTEALLEQVNNRFKVDSIESGSPSYYQLSFDVNKKYIKVYSNTVHKQSQTIPSRHVFMFIDKETGAVYKPASFKAPAKGIRFYIDFLADHPEVVDQYGSFLYRR